MLHQGEKRSHPCGSSNRDALDIKLSVAKTEVTWRLLSLRKTNANGCCAIKELRNKNVRLEAEKEQLGVCTGQCKGVKPNLFW